MDLEAVRRYIEARVALKKAAEVFKQEKRAVLIAPTGYGKTLLSLKLFELINEEKVAYRLIHVAPYRALVKSIFEEKFKRYYPKLSGYQSHEDLGVADKDPYFLRRLVVTTSDSFFYNVFRLSVGELQKVLREVSYGHFNVVLASILTSAVVFDEAHVYLEDSADGNEAESLATLVASLRYLTDVGVPLVIETAAIHSKALRALLERTGLANTKVLYVTCRQDDLTGGQVTELKRRGLEIVRVCDEEFTELNSFNWTTRLIREEDAVKMVEEFCESEPVLVIRNSIGRAVQLYDTLSKKCPETVLIHGLLSRRDRTKALSAARRMMDGGLPGVVIATQVVEAGIEIGHRVLVSDLAPVESLAQRAGRLCRGLSSSLKRCAKEGPEVYVVESEAGPYSPSRLKEALDAIRHTLGEGKQIDWRLLDSRKGFRSFAELLEETQPAGFLSDARGLTLVADVYEIYLKSEASPDVLRHLMEILGIGGLVRQSTLVSIVVDRPPGEELKSLGDVDFVSTDLARLVRYESGREAGNRCLEYVDEHIKLLVISRDEGGLKLVESYTSARLSDIAEVLSRSGSMWRLAEQLHPHAPVANPLLAFLAAKPGCYDRGRGLKIWS